MSSLLRKKIPEAEVEVNARMPAFVIALSRVTSVAVYIRVPVLDEKALNVSFSHTARIFMSSLKILP